MHLRIGTRCSDLALVQTKIFVTELQNVYPDITIEIVKIQTTGDIFYNVPLTEIGGKSLFLKEIEDALLEGRIDIAVHSTKDMPAILSENLVIGCFLARDDVRDAFISYKYESLSQMQSGAVLGTCASRRQVLAKRVNCDINIVDLRGNVVTRINKLKDNQVDAIILATAGIKRLNLGYMIKEILDPYVFMPAVGQGAICVECRSADYQMLNLLSQFNHQETAIKVELEREFLKVIDGDCRTPIGIYTEIKEENIYLKCFAAFGGQYKEYESQSAIEDRLLLAKRAGNWLKDFRDG